MRQLEFLNYKHFKIVRLSHNNIGDDGAVAICVELRHLSSLVLLDLSHNNIGPTGAQIFATGLRHCPHLCFMDLSNNRICSDGANAFGPELQCLPELQLLYLSNNNIKHLDDRMKMGLCYLASLKWLHLPINCIDLESALRVLQALKERGVVWTDLCLDDFNYDTHGVIAIQLLCLQKMSQPLLIWWLQ